MLHRGRDHGSDFESRFNFYYFTFLFIRAKKGNKTGRHVLE